MDRRLLRRAFDAIGTEIALREFEALFVNVSRVAYAPNSVPTIRYTRMNEHYRHAVDLARVILRNCSIEQRGSGLRGTAILFDMNGVVEDFIVGALREELGLSERVFPKNCAGQDLYLDRGNRIRLEPDISWWESGKCVFVGDVKYKDLGEGDKLNPDVYQMLAYCVATGLRDGLLVYAATEGESHAHELSVVDTRVSVVRLPLTGSPEILLKRIGDVARRIDYCRHAAERLAG